MATIHPLSILRYESFISATEDGVIVAKVAYPPAQTEIACQYCKGKIKVLISPVRLELPENIARRK